MLQIPSLSVRYDFSCIPRQGRNFLWKFLLRSHGPGTGNATRQIPLQKFPLFPAAWRTRKLGVHCLRLCDDNFRRSLCI
jgi:hypothetical protein